MNKQTSKQEMLYMSYQSNKTNPSEKIPKYGFICFQETRRHHVMDREENSSPLGKLNPDAGRVASLKDALKELERRHQKELQIYQEELQVVMEQRDQALEQVCVCMHVCVCACVCVHVCV